MKKLLILSIFTLHLAAYGQQGSFQINGTYPASLAGNKIVLNYQDADKTKRMIRSYYRDPSFNLKASWQPSKVTISALATTEEPVILLEMTNACPSTSKLEKPNYRCNRHLVKAW